MSPFVFGSPENKAGFYGITNMNFQMNLASNANRAWRSVDFINPNGGFITKSAFLEKVTSSSLSFTFSTGHPTDKLPSRNIVPDYELPVCRTTGSKSTAPRTLLSDGSGAFRVAPSISIASNSLHHNIIPDKLATVCRRTLRAVDLHTPMPFYQLQVCVYTSIVTQVFYRA